eukprot:359397-Chlamydomonas_euryale.AAC.5
MQATASSSNCPVQRPLVLLSLLPALTSHESYVHTSLTHPRVHLPTRTRKRFDANERPLNIGIQSRLTGAIMSSAWLETRRCKHFHADGLRTVHEHQQSQPADWGHQEQRFAHDLAPQNCLKRLWRSLHRELVRHLHVVIGARPLFSTSG